MKKILFLIWSILILWIVSAIYTPKSIDTRYLDAIQRHIWTLTLDEAIEAKKRVLGYGKNLDNERVQFYLEQLSTLLSAKILTLSEDIPDLSQYAHTQNTSSQNTSNQPTQQTWGSTSSNQTTSNTQASPSSTTTQSITQNNKVVVVQHIAPISSYIIYPFTRIHPNQNGFWMRVWTKDTTGNAQNMIVQVNVPANYCFELVNENLPLDFTYVSNDNTTSRQKLSISWASQYLEYSKTHIFCWSTHLKVLLPQNTDFFNQHGGLWFAFYPTSVVSKHACIDILVSADNAPYHETTYCSES